MQKEHYFWNNGLLNQNRKKFLCITEKLRFYHRVTTKSLGLTKTINGSSPDSTCVFMVLKNSGRNFKNGRNGNLDDFSFSIINSFLCSNRNRIAILYLLEKSPEKELSAEKIANKLGISHRTVLYHLNILSDCEVVEVRKYRQRGGRKLRSVWGICLDNEDVVLMLFKKIEKYFSVDELESIINTNIARR